MEDTFDFWKFFAGVGLFLWGMSQLEHAIKELAGRSFKNLLQKFTNTDWKGILIGTLITAILQSSSLVTLMVLAFLGGGMISLRNSLGVVLGANLGTTFTAWIVAALGFKISVADFAFPFLALGTMTYLFMNSRPNLKNSGIFLVGFGLLFLGLDYMKNAIESMAGQVNLTDYLDDGLWVFLLIGIVVTALIQSSSATIVIVLSALNANVIEIQHALAIIIGANIGTTFTLVIGAIGGTADKRRLALANFIFKLLGGAIAFLLINQLILFTKEVFAVADPLMELVLLNTLFNILMIIIFYPFLSPMEKWLKNRFSHHEPKGKSKFVKNVTTELPSVAILSLQKELHLMMKLSLKFVYKVIVKHQGPKKSASVWKKITYQPKDLLAEYMNIKSLEGELISYGIALQENNLNAEEASQLNSIIEALRTMVIGAKEFKDIIHNIKEMENSNEPMVAELLNELRKNATFNLEKIESQLEAKGVPHPTEYDELKTDYRIFINTLYQDLRKQKTDVPVSTLANVIQRVFSGLEYLRESFATMQAAKVKHQSPKDSGVKIKIG